MFSGELSLKDNEDAREGMVGIEKEVSRDTWVNANSELEFGDFVVA
jgi:hypothetical protein